MPPLKEAGGYVNAAWMVLLQDPQKAKNALALENMAGFVLDPHHL